MDVTFSKQCIHFRRSDLCPPTSTILEGAWCQALSQPHLPPCPLTRPSGQVQLGSSSTRSCHAGAT